MNLERRRNIERKQSDFIETRMPNIGFWWQTRFPIEQEKKGKNRINTAIIACQLHRITGQSYKKLCDRWKKVVGWILEIAIGWSVARTSNSWQATFQSNKVNGIWPKRQVSNGSTSALNSRRHVRPCHERIARYLCRNLAKPFQIQKRKNFHSLNEIEPHGHRRVKPKAFG